MANETRYYKIQLDHGEHTIYVPEKISTFDCDQMEQHFAIIMKQTRRRAKEDIEAEK